MVASCVVNAAAKGVIAEPSKTLQQLIAEVQNDSSLSEEMKEIMIAKLMATAPDVETFTLIEGETENVLSNFPMYKQEGEYWCMAACAQMMIKYMTGTKVPQSTLAGQLDIDDSRGGFFGNMKGVLNSYQSQNPYVLLYKENVTVQTMAY